MVTHTDTTSLGNNSLQKTRVLLTQTSLLIQDLPRSRKNIQNKEALKHSSTNPRLVNKWELGHLPP